MSKVDFSNEMFSVLAAGEEQGRLSLEYANCPFPLWDILKEIDRRSRRAERDKGVDIRGYMHAHPDEVERIQRKHGL